MRHLGHQAGIHLPLAGFLVSVQPQEDRSHVLNVAPACGCWDCSGESVFRRIHDKAGSGGADPYPGTGASLLDMVSRCTPAKVKINLHVIFLTCHRWDWDCAKVQKQPRWVLLVLFLPITHPRLLRTVGPSHTLPPLLLRLRFSFSDAEAELCTASPSVQQ